MTKKAKCLEKSHTAVFFLRTFSSLLLFLFTLFAFSIMCVCSSIVQVFVTSEILHNFGGDKELEMGREKVKQTQIIKPSRRVCRPMCVCVSPCVCMRVDCA